MAFEKFKTHLENMAILTSPGDKAKLLLYIAASNSAVSATLVEEKEVRKLKQVPVYFVSEALAYTITVLSSYPLWEIFENKESSGRIGKWATELSQYAVIFTAKTAIKSQILADFVADWTPSEGEEGAEEIQEKPWECSVTGLIAMMVQLQQRY